MSNQDQAIQETLNEINKKLGRLEDVEAIRNLITTYARACDQGNDAELLEPLFTEDATWECKGFGLFTGAKGVAKSLNAVAGKKIWWCLHYMIAPLIEVSDDGQTATGFWYLWEPATVPNSETDDAEPHWIGATYNSAMRKVDGKWYFSMIELIPNMISPFGDGWVKSKFLSGSRKAPYLFTLDEGKYHWCSCGRSKNQPFCDGSHKDTKRTPIEFTQEERSYVALCGCKYSKTKPFCDGSHLHIKIDDE